MHILLYMKKSSLSPVSLLEINSMLLLQDSTVLKDSQFVYQTNVYIFQKLIDRGFALVYIDNILLLAHTKTHVRLNWTITPDL